jgi:hypothetical protein
LRRSPLKSIRWIDLPGFARRVSPLSGFKTRVFLIDHVNTALAADNLVVAVAFA